MKNARLSQKIQSERYRERMVEIYQKLVEKMENRVRKKQDNGGLGLEEHISVELAKLERDPEKRLALIMQLNFRNKFLETKSGGKIRPVNELVGNLIKVINWTKRICHTPFEEPTDIPLLLSKPQLNKQEATFCEKAKEQKEKDLQPAFYLVKSISAWQKGKRTNKKQRKSKKN